MHENRVAVCCELHTSCNMCNTREHCVESRIPCGQCGHTATWCSVDTSVQSRTDLKSSGQKVVPKLRNSLFQTFQCAFSCSPVLVLLLFASLSPVTMSAPAPRKSQWKNPCAIDQSLLLDGATDMGISTASDAEILDRIINLNRVVRPKVDELMDQFVRSTYHADESEMLRDWGHHNMSWLGFVRATIERAEQQLQADDLVDGDGEALTLASALRTHFANLQRLAVGFEQMTVDAALYGDQNLDKFRRLQADLMHLLCELQIGLLEKRVRPDSSVTADIMGQEERDMESSRERNLRNWVIIREYKLYLSHLDKVFNALRQRLPAEQRA